MGSVKYKVMDYIDRNFTQKIKRISENFSVIVITGARQVGKTTFIKHILQGKADYIEFDPVIDIENARKDPELFLNNHKTPLILDEIQYAPEIVSVIKRRLTNNKAPGQYYLTGSQQWNVLKTMAESLAGRAVIIELSGFDFMESAGASNPGSWLDRYLNDPITFLRTDFNILNSPFSLLETIFRGFLPDALHHPLDVLNEFHHSYIRTYIERDIRLLADISDFQQFSRFYRLTGALSGQEVNYSKIGRDIGITPGTSKRWLDILSATFQYLEIPAFSLNAVKRLSNKPKGYLIDSGLICFSLAISSPTAINTNPGWGHIFESMIVNDINKKIALMPFKPNIYHWRTHAGAEVDLLLEIDGKYFPIEIKGKTHPGRNDTRGISAFRETYPGIDIQPGLVIAPTDKILKISDNDYTVPYNIY